METWIKEAFEEAGESYEYAKKINERVDGWLDREMKNILTQCENMYDETTNVKLATIMLDEDISQGLFAMCRFFAVAGYYWSLIDNGKGRG